MFVTLLQPRYDDTVLHTTTILIGVQKLHTFATQAMHGTALHKQKTDKQELACSVKGVNLNAFQFRRRRGVLIKPG
jgi:hypothetical protein